MEWRNQSLNNATKYQQLFDNIRTRLSEPDGVVQVNTAYRSTVYRIKHRDWFTVDSTGVYVRRGKGKDCISFCQVKFGKMK